MAGRTLRPVNWQDATANTIGRIQRVFALHKAITLDQQLALYAQAHLCVVAQGKAGGATEYWNTFVNVLRTLVAGLADIDPHTSFE